MEELLKNYGWGGVVLYLAVKYGHLFWQKYVKDGYISNGEVKSYIESSRRTEGLTQSSMHILSKKVSEMDAKLNGHLEKEALEDVRIGKMETEQINLKEMVLELKESREKLFQMVSDIKTFLMEKRN